MMYQFFLLEALKNSLAFSCFYAALFLIGDVFHLTLSGYGFFAYFISLLCFDPILKNRPWLEQLYFTTRINWHLKLYIFTKALISTSLALGLWYIADNSLTFHQAVLVYLVLFLNTITCHLVSFLLDELLPEFMMPLLNLSVVSFNGFFLSAGLEKMMPIVEIKIQIALYILFFSALMQSFSYLLSLKFESFFNERLP